MANNGTIVHIEVGEPLKIAMQELVGLGLFGSTADVIRAGIRNVLKEYGTLPVKGAPHDITESEPNIEPPQKIRTTISQEQRAALLKKLEQDKAERQARRAATRAGILTPKQPTSNNSPINPNVHPTAQVTQKYNDLKVA